MGAVTVVAAALVGCAAAFLPRPAPHVVARRDVARMMLPVEPSVTSLMRQTMLLADEQLTPPPLEVPSDVVETVVGAATTGDVAETVAAAAPVVAEEAKKGWFDGFVWLVEQGIEGLHGALGDGSYGVSIIVFTLVIKSITFPLNYAQIESTTKMQGLQPAIKSIQARYANDPQQMNVMMAQLYEENNLNPLAGCLPALAQIPIFIALYRALLSLAKEDLLRESFSGSRVSRARYSARPTPTGSSSSTRGSTAHPLGWSDTLAYLSLPAILIVAQSISSALLQPRSKILRTSNSDLQRRPPFLPLMVGFFSLNVPSGLCIYWIVNNVFTTASTLFIRQNTRGPKSFEDMIASPPKPTIDVSPVEDAPPTVADEEPMTFAEAHGAAAREGTTTPPDLSKSAAKKLQKAAKSRQTKVARRR
ncbi:hypothetical protein CTAYLR_010735 [Chrysophaeum taylorii]|uniref:Membrane insertase YidC/Oxa/ALB C-terminal domain-containing protein n=1 Tax=Chrysophaeum taylorii TaxID=2483200 RepID=A0AAD7U5K4_9STRA|nr:hypothetical protein CTAYLR_010735 [Chrysophaeum taylorii]